MELDSRVDVSPFVGVVLGEEGGALRAYPLALDFYRPIPSMWRSTDTILLDTDLDEAWPAGTPVKGV